MTVPEKLSKTFMVANFICTIMIIAIHYNAKTAANSAQVNFNYVIMEFLTSGIARVAVPFFAMASGFFFFYDWRGFTTYKKNVKKRVRSLLIPYVIASTFIYISFVAYNFPKSGTYDFQILTTFTDIIVHPKSVQFWFLRDLIVLTLISPLFFVNQNKMLNSILGLSLFFLWLFEVQIFPIVGGWYLLNIETLFFFWVGAFLIREKGFLEFLLNQRPRFAAILCSLWLGLVGVRLAIDPKFNIWYKTDFTLTSLLLYKAAILTGLFFLFAVASKIKSDKILYLSGFTFFAYLFHLEPLVFFIKKITSIFVSKSMAFYFCFPLAVLFVFGMAYLMMKYIKPVYLIITGGRNPRKALSRVQLDSSTMVDPKLI